MTLLDVLIVAVPLALLAWALIEASRRDDDWRKDEPVDLERSVDW